jgi:hypothetical protein
MKFAVTTYPGWNEAGKGQHSTELVCSVTGTEGAMVWRLSTGMIPAGPYPSNDKYSNLLEKVNKTFPSSMGLAAHSELSMKNASTSNYSITDSCEFLEGRACVCDLSRNLTSDFTQAFACEGFEGVRKLLETEYIAHYGKDS